MATKQQMLEELIQKAIDGGWDRFVGEFIDLQNDVISGEYFCVFKFGEVSKDSPFVNMGISEVGKPITFRLSLAGVLLDHDFAKALWGEGGREKRPVDYPNYSAKTRSLKVRGWKSHLQQMVIADDPIKYMWESIHGN